VPRLGGPDEVVERNIQAPPHLEKLLRHPVAIRQRILAELARLPEDVLRVLVVAHHEVRLEPAQPVIPGNHVGGDLLVGGPEVGPAVDVVDRGGDIETGHGSYQFSAISSGNQFSAIRSQFGSS
jgi:hypothetical protein